MTWPALFTFEFDDSEVGSVTLAGGALHIRLSVASAVDTTTRTSGFLQGVDLVVQDAVLVRGMDTMALCVGRLRGGRLLVGGTLLARVPVPGKAQVPIELSLDFRNGEALDVRGQAFVTSVKGPVAFRESYAC